MPLAGHSEQGGWWFELRLERNQGPDHGRGEKTGVDFKGVEKPSEDFMQE